MIEILHPKDEDEWLKLRLFDITSSEVAALFGMSSYITEYELYFRKKQGKVVIQEEEEWTKWGKRLQDTIAAGVAEDQGWKIRKMTEYMRDPELRMGASFDFSIEPKPIIAEPATETTSPIFQEQQVGLLEIKNVFGMIFKDQWLEDDDGNLEAPPHIELQVQHQLAVSGRSFAYIAALVGGNQIELIKREPVPEIIAEMKKRIKKFWENVDNGTPPAIDLNRDADFISSMYGYAEPGKVYDARGVEVFKELCVKHKEMGDAIKELEASRQAIKTRLLMEVGDAEKVLGDGFSISAVTVGPVDVAFRREGFRLFKINWPRGKKAKA